jgi:hypothetical protein
MTSTASRRPGRILGVVAVVALLVVAGCSGAGGGGDGGVGGSGAPDDGGSSPPSVDDSGGSSGSFYAADGRRIVVRRASMRVEIDDYESTLDSIRATATEYGGYVGDRERKSRGPWDGGTIVVEVPPENFSAVRDRVAELGRVESESVDVQDFSNEYNDTAARLADLRREERTLEGRLNRTEDPDRADDVRRELDDVRRRIRDLEERRRTYERRAAMSTITVDVHEPSRRKPPANRPDLAGFGDAFADSLYSGLVVVEWVLIVLGYGIPTVLGLFVLGIFGTVSVAGWRRIRTVLRERFGIDLRRRSSRPEAGGPNRHVDRSARRRGRPDDASGGDARPEERSRPRRGSPDPETNEGNDSDAPDGGDET